MATVGPAPSQQPPAPPRVTPPSSKGQGKTKPAKSNKPYVDPALSVDKKIVDELLLVCGVIASKDETTGKIVPVTDCLNWLQDLQRALRRDDDTFRNISLLLSSWKVVQQKLLPLVLACRYDTPLVLTIVKILVILTKPISDQAKRAGRLVIDVQSKKVPEDVIKEQIRLRDNALRQSETLMEYKRLFLRHPSHIRPKLFGCENDSADENHNNHCGGDGLLSVFVSLLADPLSRTGSSRTDADHLTIELVLHLFRNLLCADPIMKGSIEASHRSAVLHQELIGLFERELVLDVLLVLSQEMEARENAQYNLLLMEILHHLFRGQDPMLVADSFSRRNTGPSARSSNKIGGGSSNAGALQKMHYPTGGALRSHLYMERQALVAGASARHSHFGGTLVARRPDGKQTYISAGTLAPNTGSTANGNLTSITSPARRKNRKAEPFIGSAGTLAYHTRSGAIATTDAGAVTLQAQRTLNRFCTSFVSRCYGPVMKSLKNEFRRDSVRLEEGDQVIFFRIVWFFYQWWRTYRLEGGGKVPDTDEKSAVGQLIFTMDVFTFNRVLVATDTYLARKKYSDLMQAVALYQEMTQLLGAMYHSEDATEHVMALGLMDRIFYGPDPIDRLPKLLREWIPGAYTREYVCDLVQLCHTTFTLLETNAQCCADESSEKAALEDGKRRGKGSKQKSDAIARMNATAAEFDFNAYFVRKIVSPQVVFLYTVLLSQHRTNVTRISDHIAAFFVRLSRIEVSKACETAYNVDGAEGGEIKLQRSTLEPLLYNIQTLVVLGNILNDSLIKSDPESASLVTFATVIMRHYARASHDNPMLHVEALIKHSSAQRFCESVSNTYVTDELRMMAEREKLIEDYQEVSDQEDQAQGEEANAAVTSVNARRTASIEAQVANSNISDDDGEIEFGADGTDDILGAKERIEEKAKRIKIANKKLSEKEKQEQEKRRKKMLELAQKRKEKAAAEVTEDCTNDDDESKNTSEGKEKDDAEHCTKRKAEGEAVPMEKEIAGLKETAPMSTKRIKRSAVQDDSDSDDDVFGGSDAMPSTKQPPRRAGAPSWDDDDD